MPLDSSNPPASTLPTQLTSFVGRDRERAEITELLAGARLLTLTGAGGCGKTRLALWIAAEVLRASPGGVAWVPLATLSDPALVPQAAARALNIAEQPGREPIPAIVDALRGRPVWLVLDNCEHLLTACAELASAILRGAPAARLLVTSRQPLGVTGEALYPVSPLSLPHSSRPDEMAGADSVRLFVERAQAVLPGFALTPDNAPAVAEICRRLDGIPLAIELASARVNVLGVRQIAARLDDRFGVLAAAPRDSLPHQRTLRATIDWSYDLLPVEEQALLQRLSVFAGGFSLDAAEAVAGAGAAAPQPQPIAPTLFALVNKSLVSAETRDGGEARYRLLETLSQYAQEKLSASGQAVPVYDRFLDHFAGRAIEIAPRLSGPDQERWLNRIERELDNFRAALAWARDSGRIETGLRAASALAPFWHTRGYLAEASNWLETLLRRAGEDVPPLARAEAAGYAALLAGLLGDAAAAQTRAVQAVELAEAAGAEGRPLLARALLGLSNGARAARHLAEASALLERSIQLYRGLEDWPGLALALQVRAMVVMDQEDFALARALLVESLDLAQKSQDTVRIAHVNNYLGDAARCEHDDASAQAAYTASLAQFRQISAARDAAGVLHNLAHTHLALGRVEQAEALFRESLAEQRALGNAQGVAECLRGLGALAATRGLAEAAVRLLAASEAHGRDATTQWPAERLAHEHYLALAQRQLDADRFERAQIAGRALSLEQAIELALSLPVALPAGPPPARATNGGLTVREREIAALIGQGQSNAEIAGRLVLSKRTVESHVANILAKLELSRRAQVVRWAVENGLVAPG